MVLLWVPVSGGWAVGHKRGAGEGGGVPSSSTKRAREDEGTKKGGGMGGGVSQAQRQGVESEVGCPGKEETVPRHDTCAPLFQTTGDVMYLPLSS